LVIFYSTALFTQNGDASIAPYITIVFGFVFWISAFPSIFVMKKARRPSLIWGFFACFFFDYLVAIFAIFNLSFIAQVVWVCLWLVAFNLSPGPITWTYLSEVCSGPALSIGI